MTLIFHSLPYFLLLYLVSRRAKVALREYSKIPKNWGMTGKVTYWKKSYGLLMVPVLLIGTILLTVLLVGGQQHDLPMILIHEIGIVYVLIHAGYLYAAVRHMQNRSPEE